jgi:glycosyltransferase involved in cell wall biosynthesis
MDQHQHMQKLRIAFLDSWLQSAALGSGTAVAIGGLGAALQQQGHYVERIAPPTTGVWARMPLTLRRLIFNLLLPMRLRHAQYDLVVGFDWDGVCLRAGSWGLGTIRNVPYVCSIKGIIAEELQHERGRIRFLFTLLAKLEGANACRADRVITTSEYCRRKIVEHYNVPAERIGIVPEGIDLGVWEKERGKWDDTLPIQNPKSKIQNILCVARQYPRKHIGNLIRAFALVHAWMPHVWVRIVGDGPEHSKLIALAEQLQIGDNITFTGSISDEAVKHEYTHCDVFCLPSVQEGFGIVFLEAMAAGKPIVSTTAAAIGEVVQHGETGVLVPPGDVHALAGALLFLLGNNKIRTQYGLNGRVRVQQYDWQRVAAIFLQEVTPLLEG